MADVILVTGVEGMIGYAVAARLRDAGVAVVGLDRRIDGAAALGIPVHKADLRDVHPLYGTLAAHRCTAIVHCGAISGPMLARDDPEYLIATNVTGTLNVLEATRRLRLRRLVFCSSLMVYGANDGSALHEDARLATLTAADADRWRERYWATVADHGVDAVSARLAWVYGPRRQTACAIRQMLSDALAGRPTRFALGGSAMRQYVHVDDAAAALIALLDAPTLARRAYNVGGGDYRPFSNIVDRVRDLFPGADIAAGSAPDPEDPPMGPLAIDAIAGDVGWAPAIPLEAGLKSYADWLKSNRL